jgi:adenylate cyclase
MLSPKVRRNILRIIPYGVLWLIFSLIYTLLERALLGDLHYYPGTGNPYIFKRSLVTIPSLALTTGILIGLLDIVYFSKWFIKQSFSKKLLYKSFIYLVIIIVFLIILFLMNAGEMLFTLSDKRLINSAWAFFSDYSAFSIVVYVSSIVLVTQFYAEVSESIGPGVLSNFFLGKYHRPIEEDRIFMFLDMQSSTTIAEKLGHLKYFEMLKEYFFDLSGSVIDYAGIIYQYAGDEMIVSWKLKEGLKDNNCINCFFAMKTSLEKQTKKYELEFGLLPKFKAGLHCGKVTTGEIGSLKKEIIFTGDVLNTAARIQGLCNQHDVNILVSDDLIKLLDLKEPYSVQSVGENELKGRIEKMELYTIFKSINDR